jgi:hypothetical protein
VDEIGMFKASDVGIGAIEFGGLVMFRADITSEKWRDFKT